MIIGYTTGVFDLFHIGHLNLLRRAKAQCDHLIVGVTVDELVLYKNKHAVIPFEERIEIVRSIKYVDEAVPQVNMNKMEAWEKYHFNRMFVGDDWKGTEKWKSEIWQPLIWEQTLVVCGLRMPTAMCCIAIPKRCVWAKECMLINALPMKQWNAL